MSLYDVAIIGGGVSGLASGLYSRRYNLSTAVLQGKKPGGWTAIAGIIENYPGVRSISGYDLVGVMKEQNKELGVEILNYVAKGIIKKGEGDFVIQTEKEEIQAKSVVLAHGTEHRKLGLENEDKFMGKGVAICAVCDAPLFKDKVVFVVGGGDSSLKGCSLLSQYASQVYLITRESELHGEPINLKRMREKKNVKVIYNTEVTKILGGEMLEQVELKEEFEGKKLWDAQGLFVMIGFVPRADYFKDLGVKLDKRGYIEVDKFMKTTVPGVLAAGDCTNGTGGFKQAIVGAAQGAMAATSANDYLAKL